MAEPVPQHDEDGELEGYTWEQPDGSIAAYDADGDLLGVSYGSTWYERSELEAAGEGYEYDGETELQQRLAELEQRAEQPVYLPVPIPVEPDREQQTADLLAQAALGARAWPADDAARKAGHRRGALRGASRRRRAARPPGRSRPSRRRASRAGRHRLGQRPRAAAQAPGGLDGAARRPQRYGDAEAGADDLTNPEPPPSQEVYDLDSRSERHAYLADRLRGVTDADSTYSGSDYAEDASLG
jgi:hypothetical protein